MNALTTLAPGEGLDTTRKQIIQTKDLMRLWLSGKSPNTLGAYGVCLRHFTAFLGARDVEASIRELLDRGQAGANALCLEYRNSMLEDVKADRLKPKSLNLRLAAIRSVIKLARTVGLVPWSLDVPGVKAKTMKDTKGPGLERLQAMLDHARKQRNRLKAVRDVALLRIMFDLGLRRAEVIKINMKDLELEADGGPRVWIKGKGRLEPEARPLAPETVKAIQNYLKKRGHLMPVDPLFVKVTPGGRSRGRLDSGGLYWIITELGRRAGVGHVRPHGIRHSSITTLLDANGGNLREAQAFSRHSSGDTLALYDDARCDTVQASTCMVAGMLS